MADFDKPAVDAQTFRFASSGESRRWMHGVPCNPNAAVSPNQSTSIAAMIAYISSCSGQSEFMIERKLSDRFNIPNPKCLQANDFDAAIRYLADILPN
jgi:hypothetical protein